MGSALSSLAFVRPLLIYSRYSDCLSYPALDHRHLRVFPQIFVKSQSTITLGVEPTDTVDGVKQMIQAREVSVALLYLPKVTI